MHAAINWWLSGVYSPLSDDAKKWADKEAAVWERFYAAPDEMVRGVTDDSCTLHKVASCMRVDEFRELCEDFHNLVRTLTAGSHYDNLSVTLFCYGMLKHGRAAAERTGDEARTALCDRVESVDRTHSCLHDA